MFFDVILFFRVIQFFSTHTLSPRLIIFLAVSGVIETLFSNNISSFIEPTIICKNSYNNAIAKTTNKSITPTVPHKTNFVKLFQVLFCS